MVTEGAPTGVEPVGAPLRSVSTRCVQVTVHAVAEALYARLPPSQRGGGARVPTLG